ncbi:efflux RND transporter permease subunit, partial [bacterium]|nr:efflux RND transporter permease subunit [bacterium]
MAWIRLVLLYRWWVVGITVAGCVWGLFTLPQLPIDAVPDITNVQVMINTKTGTLSPLQVETLITNPLERELTGIPHVETTRSISKYGLSQLVVIFKDGTSIYWARQQIAERLQVARSVLPQDMTPEMAPISTGLGEVVMMVIEPKPGSPMEQLPASERLMALRTALDTIIRPAIKHRVPGVAEVDSTGGYRQQLAIQLEPNRMAQWGVSVGDVVARLQGLGDAGAGGMMPMPPQQAVVENHPVMRTAAQVLATPLLWSPMGQLVRVS